MRAKPCTLRHVYVQYAYKAEARIVTSIFYRRGDLKVRFCSTITGEQSWIFHQIILTATHCIMSLADPLRHLVVGYPKIAGQMNTQPETAIFRRFGELNAKDLLYRQAELAYLEKQLYKCEMEDSGSTVGAKPYYAISWYWLSHSMADGDAKQLDLVLKIRKCIKEYSRFPCVPPDLVHLT